MVLTFEMANAQAVTPRQQESEADDAGYGPDVIVVVPHL